MTRSTWQHLRVPFSLYLFPVFPFALSQARSVNGPRAALLFVILHLLVYPASNGFNSYYDRDQDSIGGLERPPLVTADLLWVSLALDAAALLLALFVGWRLAAMLALFGLASKAYSHPAIRLKARPWLGWMTVAFFQGAFTYFMISVGVAQKPGDVDLRAAAAPALISSLLFGGAYPLTQVYQHAEDARRGDRTLSRLLGVPGTFLFSGLVFALSMVLLFLYFEWLGRRQHFYLVLGFALPVAATWAIWFWQVLRGDQPTFRGAMNLNRVSATALGCCFTVLTLLR